ncbi:uncharacterized protein EV422DRAFT_592674 [Fimicolochytrium jonesii]|uniref:uncharacterized protein n=1 Tax=Fimicolochytrium jonesii TaxID=1396493 RepID=UPI0022FDFA1A|nr:uncharacterized protein EV422DRAFT_592674 [Fimicolochytrium jonesii]KAI8826581.1 hypothetical protein EV422DRAFT_592674 [Fimicolochytrium jonesii]
MPPRREKDTRTQSPTEYLESLVPSEEAVTIAELSGSLVQVTENDDPRLFDYVQAEGVLYPILKFPYAFSDPSDVQFPIARLAKAPPPSALEDQLDTLLNSVLTWWEDRKEPIARYSEKTHQVVEWVLNRVASMQQPSRKLQYYTRLQADLATRPIRTLAWHASRQVIAVAHKQNSVHIYDIVSEKWFPSLPSGLRHEFQTDITALEWSPQTGTLLAVASRHGITLWRLIFDPTPNTSTTPATFLHASTPTFAWLTFLRYPGFDNLTCLAWSPDGQYIVAGSATSSAVVVWDVAMEEATVVGGANGGTTGVWWSPNGEYLVQACTNMMRIWETRTWKDEVVNTNGRRPHSVIWHPDSRLYFFALARGRKIFSQQINSPPPSLDIKAVEETKMPLFETSTGFRVGGYIKQMAADPTCKRLAVTFEGTHNGAELVALFRVGRGPLPVLDIIGFIRGPQWHPDAPRPLPPRSPFANESQMDTDDDQQQQQQEDNEEGDGAPPLPTTIVFAPMFKRGALLTCVWEDGSVGFTPLYFR